MFECYNHVDPMEQGRLSVFEVDSYEGILKILQLLPQVFKF
jgi:hypothetical protein